MSEPWGCYIHVPWCRGICPYCSFFVLRDGPETPWERWTDAVLREHTERSRRYDGLASTLFIGGGTPSRLPLDDLGRLLDALPRRANSEVSVEANPEDVTEDWVRGACAAGVNRVSLGVQTFDGRHARRLGRGHTSPQAALAARHLASAPLRSWSMDLIFAVPGQTLEDLDRDLDQLLTLEPPHVSLYGLTLEPDTPLRRAVDRGRLRPTDSETWRQMYDRIVERLEAAGLYRYEVSNFARRGHSSAHNRGYWEDRPYMGLGPSAHGYRPDGSRYRNVADLDAWFRGGQAMDEQPTPEEAAADLLISTLRGCAGTDRARLVAKTGLAPRPAVIDALCNAGLLASDGNNLRLTAQGFPLADGITGRLVDALIPVEGQKDG